MEDNKIKVYIKIDKNNYITNINSSIFLTDTIDYIEIDEGYGDKYSHAQSNYLDKGLVDNQGRYNYKYENGNIVELEEEEKEKLFPTITTKPTTAERLASVESALSALMGV